MFHPDPQSSSIPWAERTMSAIIARDHEARIKRLLALPSFGLFDDVTDAEGELLYLISYEGMSRPAPRTLHTVEGMRSLVLDRLPREALLLSPPEYALLSVLLSGGGEAILEDSVSFMGAESLVRRLWCTVRGSEDEFRVFLPARLSVRLADVLSGVESGQLPARLSSFHSAIISALNLYGAITAKSALNTLMLTLGDMRTCAGDPVLAQRLLKASYPCIYNSRGELVLFHPGLADPARAAENAVDINLSHLLHMENNGFEPQFLLSDAERDAAMNMSELLSGALKPEYFPPSSAEDLRILMKQGVPLRDLEEVLSHQLAVHPTPAMRSALKLMQAHTPAWPIRSAGRVH